MQPDIIAIAVGIVSSIGQGKTAVTDALLAGHSAFRVMSRPGRQGATTAYLGAEMAELKLPRNVSKQTIRAASLPSLAALTVLHEAWEEALLDQVEPSRIGLIVGGSNVQQRESSLMRDAYQGREAFLRPSYALSFMDTDLCGFCTSHFDIRGLAFTIGGASASGQLAIAQAAQAIRMGQVDVCIALGALMDLSHWECQGFRAIGAMGSDRFAGEPQSACRPFDRGHDGFIYGESCASIVLESAASALHRLTKPYARLLGCSVRMDGNRNPDPSYEGEVYAIRDALDRSGLSAEQIDYINPHGTGSMIGDQTELEALRTCALSGAYLNTTKSLLGHGLSAAGTVEAAVTLLQMRAGRLHPSKNLDTPVDPSMNWVRDASVEHQIRNALTLGFGFGGINTALCWQHC